MLFFAGVYFEKIVKGTRMSLWARNFQLALFSIIIGTVGMYINDGEKIRQKGILFGYHKLVWLIVGLQAFGGILVGFVVKYTDNILKGFSAAISIVVSCIASVYLFQFNVSIQFVSGAGLVMLSTYLYGIGQSSAAKESKRDKSKLDKKVDWMWSSFRKYIFYDILLNYVEKFLFLELETAIFSFSLFHFKW